LRPVISQTIAERHRAAPGERFVGGYYQDCGGG